MKTLTIEVLLIIVIAACSFYVGTMYKRTVIWGTGYAPRGKSVDGDGGIFIQERFPALVVRAYKI